MDRRTSPRQAALPDTGVRVTLLSADGVSDVHLQGRLLEWSGGGMRIVLAQPVRPGTPVKVDCPDGLVLGEVCHCNANAPGGFAVGLRLHQIMTGLESLRRLSERLMGEERRAEPKSSLAAADSDSQL